MIICYSELRRRRVMAKATDEIFEKQIQKHLLLIDKAVKQYVVKPHELDLEFDFEKKSRNFIEKAMFTLKRRVLSPFKRKIPGLKLKALEYITLGLKSGLTFGMKLNAKNIHDDPLLLKAYFLDCFNNSENQLSVNDMFYMTSSLCFEETVDQVTTEMNGFSPVELVSFFAKPSRKTFVNIFKQALKRNVTDFLMAIAILFLIKSIF
jgi:hypothetical protein